MALYASFSLRRIRNDLVPVQFGLRIFPTGTFLSLIEKRLDIQSIQSVESCVPKFMFKILVKINMRVLMIFCFHFLFLGVGWGWGSGSETLLFGKIVTLLKARLLYITFIILYVFIIITIIINMYMHYKPWNLDGVARILVFFLKGCVVTLENSGSWSEFYFNPLDSTSPLILY